MCCCRDDCSRHSCGAGTRRRLAVPLLTAVRGAGAQWLMFFAQAGAPNYYNPTYRHHGAPGDPRSYEEHPGAGEYMCFDALMQADLEEYAHKMGRESWCAFTM
jgi:hypothetical protein